MFYTDETRSGKGSYGKNKKNDTCIYTQFANFITFEVGGFFTKQLTYLHAEEGEYEDEEEEKEEEGEDGAHGAEQGDHQVPQG